MFFADLTTAGTPELALSAIAQAVGVRDDGLTDHLRGRQSLLVADNFEHLAERAPEIVGGLLADCPALTCLVTSRRTLPLRGGHEVVIRPLPVDPAVAMFTQCVQSYWREWTPSDLVAEICARLDGLPLALELAAARMKLLSPQQLLDRLGLGGELRATLDWSYGLLDESARTLFARLSVFSGGWTLEAVEEICACRLDDLATLVDNSLVHRSGDRFFFLETVRQYASGLLADGEFASRHLDFFVALALTADRELVGPDQRRWLDLLTADQDNLRRAIGYALSTGDAVRAQQLTGALWRFWEMRGHLVEGRDWLAKALALPGASPPLVRGLAYKAAGNLARDHGDVKAARALHTRGMELFEVAGHQAGVAIALNNLGNILLDEGDHAAAADLYERSLERFRLLEDGPSIALLLNNLALALRKTPSTLGRAAGLARESMLAFGSLKDARGEARALETLARILDHTGDHRAGADLHRRAVSLRHAAGDLGGLARSFEGLAHALAALGECELPVWLLGHAAAIRATTGDHRNADDEFEWQTTVHDLQTRLPSYDTHWAAGHASPTTEALRLVSSPP